MRSFQKRRRKGRRDKFTQTRNHKYTLSPQRLRPISSVLPCPGASAAYRAALTCRPLPPAVDQGPSLVVRLPLDPRYPSCRCGQGPSPVADRRRGGLRVCGHLGGWCPARVTPTCGKPHPPCRPSSALAPRCLGVSCSFSSPRLEGWNLVSWDPLRAQISLGKMEYAV